MRFKIIGVYNGVREVIDEFDTRREANKMLLEYKLSYGNEWSLYVSTYIGFRKE